MVLQDLKPFSLSRNFFDSVVTPLVNSGRLRNEAGLLELLKKLHTALWQKSGIPSAFSGAIAGDFQEILDAYKFAVVKGVDVQLGSVAGTGGDTVVFHADKTKTSQFKVTDVDTVDRVEEHIAKAAWQLTGASGERPADGSKRVVEVVIQGDALAATTAAQWQQCIVDALANGYTKQVPNRTSAELYAAVDAVKITTSRDRHKFPIAGAPGARVVGAGTRKDPKTEHGYVFNQGRMRQHWLWLCTWFRAEQGKYSIPDTIKHGVGTGAAKTPAALPRHTVEIRPLFDDIEA
jgi:hypothetical protein